MRVTLVNPSYDEPRVLKFLGLPSIPLGYGCVAASLEKAGHEVTVVDGFAYRQTPEKTIQALKETHPDVTGISCVTCNVDYGIQIAQAAREFSRVIVGGTHPSLVPESVVDCADVVVCGEGEQTMQELLSGARLETVDGILFKSGGKVVRTKPRSPVENLDTVPFPARHLFPMERYRQFGTMLLATMLTSRGCPMRCSYCTISQLYPTWRGRSPENVVEEIELLVKEYRVKGISIVDEDFLVDFDRAWRICELIEAKQLRVWWGMQTRVDRIPEVDVLKRFFAAGCEFVLFGVESANERTMKGLNRNIPNERFLAAAQKCQQAGMRIAVSAILGFPGETEADALETVRFVLKLNPEYAFFGVPTPFPGTRFHEYCEQNGLIRERDLRKYTIMSPIVETDVLPLERSRKLLDCAYRKFYYRPLYITKRSIAEMKRLDRDTLKSFIRWTFGGLRDCKEG